MDGAKHPHIGLHDTKTKPLGYIYGLTAINWSVGLSVDEIFSDMFSGDSLQTMHTFTSPIGHH